MRHVEVADNYMPTDAVRYKMLSTLVGQSMSRIDNVGDEVASPTSPTANETKLEAQ